MSTRSRYYAKLYKDSVSLMALSTKIMAVSGIEAGSVMAAATNVENLTGAGLAKFDCCRVRYRRGMCSGST